MKFTFTNSPVPSADIFTSREYLLTNGKGGYASSTLADCHTRKYHGLLALPVPALGKIYMLLSKLELSVVSGSNQYDLSVNQFPNALFPDGFRYIRSVVVGSTPVTTYAMDEGKFLLKKSISMPRGKDSVLVRYELVDAPKPVMLKVVPFLAYREIHAVARQNGDIRPRTYFEPDGFKIDPYPNLPALYIQTSRLSTFYPAPDWWRNFEYLLEQERGYEYQEDLFSPGIFEIKLKKDEAVIIRASLAPAKQRGIELEWKAEEDRPLSIAKQSENEEQPLRTLKFQASHFVTDKPAAILAGFPWFCNEWGRDAFISLPGLLLCTDRHKDAFELLKRFASFEKGSLLPNTIAPYGERAYNSIDTPFWFIAAVQQYLANSGDKSGIELELLPTMAKILAGFLSGRTENAAIGGDGLLYAGNSMTQLTWMDASVNRIPVTPRHGAAVEINALYYNALAFLLENFNANLNEEIRKNLQNARALFESSFQARFWNEENSCLIDVYRGPTDKDKSIRPNQLFAIGLPFTCIDREKALAVLETVKNQLVTPVGLRTLSARDENFIAVYEGDQTKRDKAYHQGVIWPWLIGIYHDALKKYSADKKTADTSVRNTFSPLWNEHLGEGCLFQISELFTPVNPHQGTGSPAQAWSLAEIIRVLTATSEKTGGKK